jgi:tetratricopeptide (TPR) repeat protein
VVLVREATRHEALLARLPAIALDDGAPVPPVVVAMADAFRAAASGDEEGALRRYQDALALEPDHLLALYSLGVLREKRGEHREARALFERLAERAPESELADQARVRLRTLR